MSDRAAVLEKRSAKELDDALNGAPATDAAVTELMAVATLLREGLAPEVPEHRIERASFIQGVAAANPRSGWVRFFGPATVAAVVILVAVMLGRSALPGQTFYPVRQALRAVGLAPYSLEEMDGQVATASRFLDRAEALKATDPGRARGLAFEAVKVLGFVEQTLPDVASDRAETRLAEVRLLLTRAQDILITDPRDRVKGNRTVGSDNPAGDDEGPNQGRANGSVKKEKHKGRPAHNRGQGEGQNNAPAKANAQDGNDSQEGQGGDDGKLGEQDGNAGDDSTGRSSEHGNQDDKSDNTQAKEGESPSPDDDSQEDDSDDDQGSDDESEIDKELKKLKGHSPEKTLPGDDETPGHRSERGRGGGGDD